MGVVVFASDVLIGFLSASDAHHDAAVGRVRAAMEPGTRRLLCAVNYAEILIGPLRVGQQGVVDEMLSHFTIEVVAADQRLARRAAEVRLGTGLKLPDAFAVAVAVDAGAELESFDERVVKAHAQLRRSG